VTATPPTPRSRSPRSSSGVCPAGSFRCRSTRPTRSCGCPRGPGAQFADMLWARTAAAPIMAPHGAATPDASSTRHGLTISPRSRPGTGSTSTSGRGAGCRRSRLSSRRRLLPVTCGWKSRRLSCNTHAAFPWSISPKGPPQLHSGDWSACAGVPRGFCPDARRSDVPRGWDEIFCTLCNRGDLVARLVAVAHHPNGSLCAFR
jgi:hypothetical protein